MQLWSVGAADGQGGGQAFDPGPGGGQVWLGGTGSTVLGTAGVRCAEKQGSGQDASCSHGGGGGGQELPGLSGASEHGGGQ